MQFYVIYILCNCTITHVYTFFTHKRRGNDKFVVTAKLIEMKSRTN